MSFPNFNFMDKKIEGEWIDLNDKKREALKIELYNNDEFNDNDKKSFWTSDQGVLPNIRHLFQKEFLQNLLDFFYKLATIVIGIFTLLEYYRKKGL